jgi:uncharacterized membrane protein YdjX (TVP38/TMEM64 family)
MPPPSPLTCAWTQAGSVPPADPAAPDSPPRASSVTNRPLLGRRLILGGFVVLALVAAFWLLPSRHWVVQAYEWIRGLGRIEGFVAFVAVYTALSAVGLPTSPLNVGAGLLFGLLWGFLASMAGVMAACILCFVVARYVARAWVLRRLRSRPKFQAVLAGLKDETWRMILLTRLNPVLPAAVASYCFGVTPIKFRTYLAASLIGNVPLCLALTYFGSAGQLAFGRQDWSVWDYALYGLGLVSTVVLTVWVTRFTKRKLAAYEAAASHTELAVEA